MSNGTSMKIQHLDRISRVDRRGAEEIDEPIEGDMRRRFHVRGLPEDAGGSDEPASFPPPRSGPSGLYSRPFLIVERLLEQIGERRAAELEEVRADLATEAAGRWGVLFLPFRDCTARSPCWAGTWVAVRGRWKSAETIQADNPLALRDQIVGRRWRRFHPPVAA